MSRDPDLIAMLDMRISLESRRDLQVESDGSSRMRMIGGGWG